MASEGGKGNFGDTGGYGGNFNSGGGGLNNRSASMGGNPTTQSGGVGDYGASQAAASRVGQSASSMNASANQAMAAYGYKLNNNGVWAKPQQPMYNKSGVMTYDPSQKITKKQPWIQAPVVKIVKNPITGVLTPTPQKPPGWTSQQWANWQTHYYNSQQGVMQPPQRYSPNLQYPGLTSEMTGYGNPHMPGPGKIQDRIHPDYGIQMGGHNDAPTGLGPDWSSPDYGNPSGPGGVGGVIGGDYRGLALGGISMPNEPVVVGERGPELMQAPGGATVQPMVSPGPMGPGGQPMGNQFQVGSPNLGLMHDQWRRRAIMDTARGGQRPMQQQASIGNGRMNEVQQILRGLRQQRRAA